MSDRTTEEHRGSVGRMLTGEVAVGGRTVGRPALVGAVLALSLAGVTTLAAVTLAGWATPQSAGPQAISDSALSSDSGRSPSGPVEVILPSPGRTSSPSQAPTRPTSAVPGATPTRSLPTTTPSTLVSPGGTGTDTDTRNRDRRRKPTTAASATEDAAVTVTELPPPTSAPSSQELTGEVLTRVNAARATAGCPALRVDSRLADTSVAHVNDMVARQFFDHTNPDGLGPGDRAGRFGFRAGVGENLAVGFVDSAAVVDSWLQSPGHRANILNCSYTVTGIGFNPGAVGAELAPGTWVETFGTE